MSSHLQRVHKEEKDVALVLLMTKGSIERRQAWAKLLNEGDYNYNYNALENNSGVLIPKYRSKGLNIEGSVVCSHCKGLFKKSLLYLHVKRCFNRDATLKRGKGNHVREGKLLMPMPQNISESFYQKVIGKMRQDDITRLIQNDSLLVQFGERMFYRKDMDEHTPNQVSSRLRELGRLLKKIRVNSQMKISSIKQAIHPSNFNVLLQSVREVAEYDESTHKFGKGSVALRLGYSLKKCSAVLKADAHKQNDTELVKVTDSFDALFKGDWYDYITSTASQSIQNTK